MSERVEHIKLLNRNRAVKYRLLKKQKLNENSKENENDCFSNIVYNNCVIQDVIDIDLNEGIYRLSKV